MTSHQTPLKVRKPKAILFDMVGTVIKSNFIDRVLFRYIAENLEVYLKNNWGNKVLMHDIEMLRSESQRGGNPIAAPNNPGVQKSVEDYVRHCQEQVLNHEAIRIFRFHMIFDGYNRDKLKTAVYTDAATCLSKWAKNEGIDMYVLSNGFSYAMKKFLSKTNHSDLSLIVKKYFDSGKLGSLEDPKTYTKVISDLGYPAQDIIFLTHWGREGVAAYNADLNVILVETHREDVAREQTESVVQCGLPLIRSFDDLIFGQDAPPASSMVDKAAMSKATSEMRSSAGGSGASSTQSHGSKGGSASSMGGSSRSNTAVSGSSVSRSKSSSAAPGSSSSASSASSSKGSSASASSSKSRSKH